MSTGPVDTLLHKAKDSKHQDVLKECESRQVSFNLEFQVKTIHIKKLNSAIEVQDDKHKHPMYCTVLLLIENDPC